MLENPDSDLADALHGFTNYVMNERVRAYNEGVDAERKRCADLVTSRAAVWRGKHGDGACSLPLEEECEDIASAIRACG